MQWSYHLCSTITATTSKFKMAVEIGVFRRIPEALYFFSHFSLPSHQRALWHFVGASNWRVNYLLVSISLQYISSHDHHLDVIPGGGHIINTIHKYVTPWSWRHTHALSMLRSIVPSPDGTIAPCITHSNPHIPSRRHANNMYNEKIPRRK